jgi:hypothetical protein
MVLPIRYSYPVFTFKNGICIFALAFNLRYIAALIIDSVAQYCFFLFAYNPAWLQPGPG